MNKFKRINNFVFSFVFCFLLFLASTYNTNNQKDVVIKSHINYMQDNKGDYSIVFYNNDEIVNQMDNLAYIPGTLPEMPNYENYIFDGWYTSIEYIDRAIEGYKLSSNTNLYAKYLYRFSIDFIYDESYDGDKLDTIEVYDYIPDNLFKGNSADYSFVGFYADSNYNTLIVEGTKYTDLLSYIDENYCIKLYVNYLYKHIHSCSSQSIEYEDGMYVLKRNCDECGFVYIEKQKSQELNIEDFISNPTFENFENLKEQSVQYLKDSILGLNDGAITYITDNFVYLLDEIELSPLAYKELIDLYFITLSKIKNETERQQFLYLLEDEYNTINSSNRYTKATMTILQNTYGDIKYNVEQLEDNSLLLLYEQNWNDSISKLQLRYVQTDDKMFTIYNDNGFKNGTQLIVSTIDDDKNVSGYIYLATYKLSIINGNDTIELPDDAKLSIEYKDKDSFWKVKAFDSEGNTSKTIIKENVIIINSISSDTISIFYKEPYSIKPLIIIAISVAGLLVCLLIYFIIRGRLSDDYE